VKEEKGRDIGKKIETVGGGCKTYPHTSKRGVICYPKENRARIVGLRAVLGNWGRYDLGNEEQGLLTKFTVTGRPRPEPVGVGSRAGGVDSGEEKNR